MCNRRVAAEKQKAYYSVSFEFVRNYYILLANKLEFHGVETIRAWKKEKVKFHGGDDDNDEYYYWYCCFHVINIVITIC